MSHDREGVGAKAEASFKKPEQIGETGAARAERDVREQIERLRQLRLGAEIRAKQTRDLTAP